VSYVIHVRLEDFRAQTVGDRRLQDFRETRLMGVQETDATSVLVVTGRDAGGTVHAARIVVERASLIGGSAQAIRERMHRNVEAAQALVEGALGRVRRGGVLLEPGLWDDLARFGCEADLWRWEGTGAERTLLPLSE
jgi:hypothetical protein